MIKNKIGARCLSKEEATLILPTYEQIYEQISQFREELTATPQESNQKTNNIGIIGVRGAGKTSILKTIREELLNTKNGDVILPIIIPENMSESSTLMATILGMLGEKVKERITKDNSKNPDCLKRNNLERAYDAAVRQYTFIQKEYRNLLIQEYTTENDYVKDSAKVFNSDTEFIKKFIELVNALTTTTSENNNLIFIFIDDIDLSTHRCSDVVKTLLSYLSHERIVTFISGDINTFEEALTLEFLRRENVLTKDSTEIKVSKKGDNSLLESKKQLAYEYLKKVIPPSHRHNIKHWSLEEKGNYIISGEPGTVPITFSNLLKNALHGWIDMAFFFYQENENSQLVNLPYTYHLFDDTSRGLNNVYNVLNELAEKRNTIDKETAYLPDKKRLLETIIASKTMFNNYREVLFNKMFTIGNTMETSKVFFDNALAIIYETEEYWEPDPIEYIISSPVTRVSLFILVDFAARIIYEKNYYTQVSSNECYEKLKRNAMADLFSFPEVAEKVMEPLKFSWVENNTNKETLSLQKINHCFMTKGDFVFNLAYYMNLSLSKMAELYNPNTDNDSDASIALKQHCAIALWKAIQSVAFINNMQQIQIAGTYYSFFGREFGYLQDQLSDSSKRNITLCLLENECKTIIKKYTIISYDYQTVQRLLLNTVTQLAEDIDKYKEFDDNLYLSEKEAYQHEVLKLIDRKKLWNENAAEIAITYLKTKVEHFLDSISKDWRHAGPYKWKIATEKLHKTWNTFWNSNDGVTQTKSWQTKQEIRKLLFDETNTYKAKVSLDEYMQIITLTAGLAGNYRVWYGRTEAQIFLNSLREAYALPPDDIHDDIPVFVEQLQFYLNSKIANTNATALKEDAQLLTTIKEGLSAAQQSADEKTIYEFISTINESLSDPITEEEYEALFS